MMVILGRNMQASLCLINQICAFVGIISIEVQSSISLMKEQFVLTHRYKILQDTGKKNSAGP